MFLGTSSKSPSFTESTLDILPFSCYYCIHGKRTFHERRRRGEEPLGGAAQGAGIRQEELAKALSVSRQTIGSLENGRYNPSILLAFRIARYFDLPIEEIFLYDEEDTL